MLARRSGLRASFRSRASAEPLERRVLLADTVALLQDINQTSDTHHTDPAQLTASNGTVFFSGLDQDAGRELMATDGTQAGTRIVKDINPGAASSNPFGLTDVNGTLFFFADDGAHGYELWKSDGTAAGTTMVADVNPGPVGVANTPPGGPTPYARTAVLGNTLFFITSFDDGLWKSDGTAAGTKRVASVNFDPTVILGDMIGAAGGNVYFTAEAGDSGLELWKTDGTPGGTALVKDIIPGPGSSFPLSFTRAGDLMYFTAVPVAGRDDNLRALFRTDGTREGTIQLADEMIYDPQRAAVGSTLFFVKQANALANPGDEADLWKTDGTVAGTVKVRDFVVDPSHRPPRIVGTYSGGVLMSAYDRATGTEFWKSDGSPAGTVLVKDFAPGVYSSDAPTDAQEVNGTIWLTGYDAERGYELWKSDGTDAGTTFVAELVAGGPLGSGPAGGVPREFVASSSGKVVFIANSIAPSRLGYVEWDVFSTDGTAAGTRILRPAKGPTAGSDPTGIMESGGAFYFIANDGVHGPELWRSGGTPGDAVRITDMAAAGMEILGDLNGTLIFTAYGNTPDAGTWRSDGTAAGTVKLTSATGSGGTYAAVVGDNLYFRSVSPPPVFGESTEDLWATDGSVAGTRLVRQFGPYRGGVSSPRALSNVNGTLMFFASDGQHGVELWKSDGTRDGTVMVKDINPGPGSSSSTTRIVAVGNEGFFSAFSPDTGYEVWKTDGTEAGTVLVKDLTPGANLGAFGPEFLTAFDGLLYFAQDTGGGRRLYQTNGTADGTFPALVQGARTLTGFNSMYGDVNQLLINASEAGVAGTNLYRAGEDDTRLTVLREHLLVDEYETSGAVYMAARGESEGSLFDADELWVTAGTAESTRRVVDLFPGTAGAHVADLTAFEGVMLFAATDPQHGREPYVLTTDERAAEPRDAAVVGRHVFYNHSSFDGDSVAAGPADDGAIATDKSALLPGQTASSANVTNFSRGINGIMIDVRHLARDGNIEELGPDDFIIRTGPSGAPGDLASGPRNFTVTVRRDTGAGGSDRVTLTWPDGAIKNEWLQVTMKPTHETGLRRGDVFYFGNLAGDANGDFRVNALDLAVVRRSLFATSQPITSAADVNRDGKVNALDLAAVKANYFRSVPVFTAPGELAAPAAGQTATSLLRES